MFEKPTCKNCTYFRHSTDGIHTSYYGFCHRYPPHTVAFPSVNPDSWCGEHKELSIYDIAARSAAEAAEKARETAEPEKPTDECEPQGSPCMCHHHR